MMVRTPIQEIKQKLLDLEYRKLFGTADAKNEFAITLATVRRDLNMTQQELADRCGATQPYIAKLEGGEANPTLGTIGSMLAVIGCRLAMDAKPLLQDVLAPPSTITVGQSSTVADTGILPLDWECIYEANGAGGSTAQVTSGRYPMTAAKSDSPALVGGYR